MNNLVLTSLLQVVKLNEAYIKVEYWLEGEGFDNVPALIRCYVGNRKPVSQVGLVAFCAPALRFKPQLLFFSRCTLLFSD